jgi:two-component system, OmpR family, phosphate regulon sensor histidine kinase PhoR
VFSQLFLFSLVLALGAFLGQVFLPRWGGATAGVAAAALLAWTYVHWGAARVLAWLRQAAQQDMSLSLSKAALPALADAPERWLPANWQEVIERSRKLMRQGERFGQVYEQRLQDFLAAIQASPNGVLLLDELKRIEWCNQTAAKHLGLDATRDLMQHMTHLVRDPAFMRYLESGAYEQEVRLGMGVRQISLQAHRYGLGRLLLLSRDVTAVEQAEAMRRDFVANVSHEIRTPLTVLCGLIESLQTLPLSPAERDASLHTMQNQAQRMNSLVADLLTLSRLESSPWPDQGNPVSIKTLLLLCKQEATNLSAGRHRLNFVWLGADLNDAARDLMVKGSPNELQSALSNLVSNAVRYTPAGGTVTVSAQLDAAQSLTLTVSDTGAGIAPEHLPRLTERFYRVDSSRSRDTGGTGLGLAIVKHVMQRHGGQLRIESQLGLGSRFSLVFEQAQLS